LTLMVPDGPAAPARLDERILRRISWGRYIKCLTFAGADFVVVFCCRSWGLVGACSMS
jgi:hypothetical protein